MKKLILLGLLLPTFAFSQNVSYKIVKIVVSGNFMRSEYEFKIVKATSGHTFMVLNSESTLHDPDCVKCINRQKKMIQDIIDKKKK